MQGPLHEGRPGSSFIRLTQDFISPVINEVEKIAYLMHAFRRARDIKGPPYSLRYFTIKHGGLPTN